MILHIRGAPDENIAAGDFPGFHCAKVMPKVMPKAMAKVMAMYFLLWDND